MESTYGDRLHGTVRGARKKLRDVVRDTVRRRGKVIIPAFAVGRTQEIVYALNQLEAGGDIPPLPIFVDSPLAVNATEVFRMHPEEWDEEVRAFLAGGRRRNPFDFAAIEYVRDAARSKQLNYMTEPAIIISASGMAENGRILHHLKNNIEDARQHGPLRRLSGREHAGPAHPGRGSPVRIFGEEYECGRRWRPSTATAPTPTRRSCWSGRSRAIGAASSRPSWCTASSRRPSPWPRSCEATGMKQVAMPERGQSFEF